MDCGLCEQVPTLGHLPCLEIVELDGLHNLRRIGAEFYGSGAGIDANTTSNGAAAAGAVFPALRKLALSNMMNLEEWSEISSLPAGAMSMKEFFPRLELLSISKCPRLITIPDQDSENILILIEDLLASSKFLRSLEIRRLNKLRYFPTQLLNLTSLERLRIESCKNLRSFCVDKEAAVFNCLKSLKQLHLYSCRQLIVTDSDELRSLTSLQNLTIQKCPGLASCWGEGMFCLSGLRKLMIGGFSRLDHFPWPSTSADAANVKVVQQCPFISLESLELWDDKRLKYLPDQLQHLTALKNMEIGGFMELEALPEWLGNLSSLQSLTLWGCPNLMSLPSLEAIQRLTNLRNLIVRHCPLLKERFQSGEEGRKIAHIFSVQIRDW